MSPISHNHDKVKIQINIIFKRAWMSSISQNDHKVKPLQINSFPSVLGRHLFLKLVIRSSYKLTLFASVLRCHLFLKSVVRSSYKLTLFSSVLGRHLFLTSVIYGQTTDYLFFSSVGGCHLLHLTSPTTIRSNRLNVFWVAHLGISHYKVAGDDKVQAMWHFYTCSWMSSIYQNMVEGKLAFGGEYVLLVWLY
jgi:hypothetical protein